MDLLNHTDIGTDSNRLMAAKRIRKGGCPDLAGLAGEGKTAAVADLDAVEEAAGLCQQLQHVRQRQERDVSVVKSREASQVKLCLRVGYIVIRAVLWIRDILVRIRIRGSVPLTNGPGSRFVSYFRP